MIIAGVRVFFQFGKFAIIKVLPGDTHWLLKAKRPSPMDHQLSSGESLRTGEGTGNTISIVVRLYQHPAKHEGLPAL